MTDFKEIPILDISALVNGDDTTVLSKAFAKAYGETGFTYIVSHGIIPALRAGIFKASKGFHDLPEPTKQAIALNRNHRGYIAINTSTDVNSDLAVVDKPNQSASFMIMREDPVANPEVYLSGPNQWPEIEGFRQTCGAYVAAMNQLGYQLMTLALQAIGVVDQSVLRAFDEPTIWLQLLKYPPQPPQSPDDLYGSAPHMV